MYMSAVFGLTGLTLLLEVLCLFTLLLLTVPGGLSWPPLLIALHLFCCSRHVWQPTHTSTRSATDVLAGSESPPPGRTRLRVHRRDFVWASPWWLRIITFTTATLQFLSTLIVSLVMSFTAAFSSTAASPDTHALAWRRTLGAYTVHRLDGEWARFALTLCLCVALAVFTLPLPLVLHRAARAKGKRLALCHTQAHASSATTGTALRDSSTCRWLLCVLVLTAVAAALVPGLDIFPLLLWHLGAAVSGALVLSRARPATSSPSATVRGSLRSLPEARPDSRRTHPHRTLQTVLSAILTCVAAVLLLAHACLQLPVAVWLLGAHNSRVFGQALTPSRTVMRGTQSGWSGLWCTENWLDALSSDALAWRKACQIWLLLAVAIIARHRMMWSPPPPRQVLRYLLAKSPKKASHAPVRDEQDFGGLNHPLAEEEGVVIEEKEDGEEDARQRYGHFRRPHRRRLTSPYAFQRVCRERRSSRLLRCIPAFIQEHFSSLIMIPTLLLTALGTQDLVAVLLWVTALVSLVVCVDWWQRTGVLIATVLVMAACLTEVGVIACSGAVPATSATRSAQRALFLVRAETASVQPSSSRYVWCILLELLAADVLLLTRYFHVRTRWRADRTGAADAAMTTRETEELARQAQPDEHREDTYAHDEDGRVKLSHSARAKAAHLSRAYAHASHTASFIATASTSTLDSLAKDFSALLDGQAAYTATSPSTHAEGVSALSDDGLVIRTVDFVPLVLRVANKHATARCCAEPDEAHVFALTHLLMWSASPSFSFPDVPLSTLTLSRAAKEIATCSDVSVPLRATWSSLWRLAACGEPLSLSSLVASMGACDSRLRMATWRQLASPIERPVTPAQTCPNSVRRPEVECEETSVFASRTAPFHVEARNGCTESERHEEDLEHTDVVLLSRLLAAGSPGQGALSFLDFLWLTDTLHAYHADNTSHVPRAANEAAGRQTAKSRSWDGWRGLARHVAGVYAMPVLVLVLFAAAMTVQDLDVLNALYVLFFLLFICQRAWQSVLSTRGYALWCRWRQRLFIGYVALHVSIVFAGHLVQTTYGLPRQGNATSTTGSNTTAAETVVESGLSFVGIFTNRPVAQLLVYVVLLYLVRVMPANGEQSLSVVQDGNDTTAGRCVGDSLAACLAWYEWTLFEARPGWQRVRRGLRIGVIGLILVLLTILLQHSVLVLGLGVLYSAALLTSGRSAPARRSEGRLGLPGWMHNVLLTAMSVYCPAVLLWTAVTQLPRVRTSVIDALTAVGYDPRELGVYARDVLGRGATVPALLLPWYLLSPLTASLLVLVRQQQTELRRCAKAARGEHGQRRASSGISQDSCPCVFCGRTAAGDSHSPHYATKSVRLAQHLFTHTSRMLLKVRAALVDVQFGPLAQWCLQLAVAVSNVSCLGFLYGLAYAVSWPAPLGLAVFALVHVFCQYLYGLTLTMRVCDGDIVVGQNTQSSQCQRYLDAKKILNYVGLHAPLSSSALSARYMLIPILVAVAAVSRLVLDRRPNEGGDEIPTTPTTARTPDNEDEESSAQRDDSDRLCASCAAARHQQRREGTVTTHGSPRSHEPAVYSEEEPPKTGAEKAAHTSNACDQCPPRQRSALACYLSERAFGDVIYEALTLMLLLAVALLMDTVISVALLILTLVVVCVGRTRLLQSRALTVGLEVAILALLMYVYGIELGLPDGLHTHTDVTAHTSASPSQVWPALLQRAHHDACGAWDHYAGCQWPPHGWFLLCLTALLHRLLRRHRVSIMRATLAPPIDGCRDVDSLFRRYDKNSKRDAAAQEHVLLAVAVDDHTPVRRPSVAGQHEEVEEEMAPFSPPSPAHPVEPPLYPSAHPRDGPKTHTRQTRIMAALHAFEGCPDRVRDPQNLLEWLYKALAQLLPASVLLFVHGVLLANMAGVLMAVLALTLLCARRRLVERWTSVWRWTSLGLLLLMVPQWLWHLPVMTHTIDSTDRRASVLPPPHWKVSLMIVLGVSPWPARAVILHVLVLWSAVVVERRLFNEFHFAPYLLGGCHRSASARSRRERIRWLYQARWQSRELDARAQEQQLEETLQRLAEARCQRAPPSAFDLSRTPLRRSLPTDAEPNSNYHHYVDGAAVSTPGATDDDEETLAAAEAVLRSVSRPPLVPARGASPKQQDPRARQRTGSIAFVIVESPPLTQPTLLPALQPCTRPSAALVSSSPSDTAVPQPVPPRLAGPLHGVKRDARAAPLSADVDDAPAPTPVVAASSRFGAACCRTAQKLTGHLLAHSYQPDLPAHLASHTFLSLCVAIYRYVVRHSAGLCFLLLLVNYALSGVLTDMFFSLSALLFGMVVRPWAGQRYWYGFLFGLVASTAVKLVCQVLVTRLDSQTLPPAFLYTVRVVFLDLGRTSDISRGAMRVDILLDFACVFAVLAHCHSCHDLGLFELSFKTNHTGVAAEPPQHGAASSASETTATRGTDVFDAEKSGGIGLVVSGPSAQEQRCGVQLFRSRGSSVCSLGSASARDALDTASTCSPSAVFLDVCDDDVCVSDGTDEVLREGGCERLGAVYEPQALGTQEEAVLLSELSTLAEPQQGRKHASCLTDLGRSFGRAVREVYRQRRGRRGAGADHYTIQFWLDSVAVIVFCWAFFAIRYASAGARSNNVVRSLERNLLPGLFVVLLFVAVLLLCLERIVYVCHNGVAKYVLHALMVLLYHAAFMVWRIEGSIWRASTASETGVVSSSGSSSTHSCVSAAWMATSASRVNCTTSDRRGNAPVTAAAVLPPSPSPLAPALALLLVKLASAWVSAWQLRAGYPLMRRHDPFTARTDLFHWLGHIIARSVPFLLEVRLFLDWVFSPTALKIQHWWLLEDVHHAVYLRFVDISDIRWTSRRKGKRFPPLVKLYQGVVGVLAVLAALFFPLFFYSTFSPQTQPTFVRNLKVELTLQPVAHAAVGAVVLYAAEADVPRRTQQDVLLYEPFARTTVLPLLEPNFLSDARVIQSVALPPLSAVPWSVTSETLRSVHVSLGTDTGTDERGRATAGGPVRVASAVKIRLRLSYVSQTQSERDDAAEDAFGLVGNAVATTLEYTLPRLSVQQLAAALDQAAQARLSSPQCTIEHTNRTIGVQRSDALSRTGAVVDLPHFIYPQWINTGSTLQSVTDTRETAVRDCHLQMRVDVCDHSLSSVFYCDESTDTEAGVKAVTTATATWWTRPQLFVLVRSLDATTSTGILGYLSSLGILAVYTTLVLALSNALRGIIAGGAHQVILRQVANPQPIARLLRHLYWIRSSASNGQVQRCLWLEQHVFLELVDLLRDPTRLLDEGGRRVNDYDDQGVFQESLARAAERPF